MMDAGYYVITPDLRGVGKYSYPSDSNKEIHLVGNMVNLPQRVGPHMNRLAIRTKVFPTPDI
jgi:hypothetical protein